MNDPLTQASAAPEILLVDDDPGAIQLLGTMLAGLGRLRFATSGKDALRLARDLPPDLILLDAEMPGMSGFQLMELLKAENRPDQQRDTHLATRSATVSANWRPTVLGTSSPKIRITNATTIVMMSDEELTRHHALRVTATEYPGYPCRVTLDDAQPGEEVVLLNFEHLPVDSPYRSSHAIYVRANATSKCEAIPRDLIEWTDGRARLRLHRP